MKRGKNITLGEKKDGTGKKPEPLIYLLNKTETDPAPGVLGTFWSYEFRWLSTQNMS